MDRSEMSPSEAYQTIIKKAIDDPEFKAALAADPRKAVEDTLGVAVPEDMEIKVLEQSPKVTYLVLPWEPEDLSDEALDEAAGGSCWMRGGGWHG